MGGLAQEKNNHDVILKDGSTGNKFGELEPTESFPQKKNIWNEW